MQKKYYKLPLNTASFFNGVEHDVCGIKESIAHHIHLINTSYFGECIFDSTFGCSIWEIDFDNLKSTNNLRNVIVDSLKESLKIHEKRLVSISIEVKIKQEELWAKDVINRIKKRLDIKVNGRVKKTNEPFTYTEYFYIGPLSY